ncbi:F-box/WD repeat-containing protein 5 [Episyrphus balteatus]|uniref:F-box/WD repeat-containing protein 5 n=1 Tax=Episyrphus balteatus TaxID=286459 RepID=UPI0024869094|nr:F-box/WD repeat-containing protein 5 [Episyrphus balteatus]
MDFSNNSKKIRVESANESSWWTLPEPVLIEILLYLPPKDIINAGFTCQRWYDISNDNTIWKKKFQQRHKTDHSIRIKPGSDSWKSEYKRLACNIPFVLSQKLKGHTHQVLHVSFSHNGKMFATCSKDGYVIIWNSDHPCTERHSHNMKQFSWKYTQYSQFNQSDTLLMVSGVHFGQPHSTSGEIAVFTVDDKNESTLRCRVVNRPYDVFGTWFCDQYLISGDLHWLAHLVSTSVLWLNKASQEVSSEHVPVMNQLYKFYNRNASSVRAVIMAKCPWLDESNDPLAPEKSEKLLPSPNEDILPETSLSSKARGNPLSNSNFQSMSKECIDEDFCLPNINANSNSNYIDKSVETIHYLNEYHVNFADSDMEKDASASCTSAEAKKQDITEEYDEMENSIPRYIIFSTGSKTYTPHQVGIKRVRNITFPKRLDPGPSLKERIAAKKRAKEEQQNQPRVEPDWWNFDAVADRFDKVDKVIDLHGHIIGMALSPDHRYLYVNTRPWPRGYIITNALDPPPIAQEIDIHVIDLMSLKLVGNMLKSHKAYTPGTECFFIFLDVSDNYVASGAEDMHAYLWDRYYGICLAKYKHNDVVNCVAFNPRDSEMLVTTSDDYSIKIWRSKESAKSIGLDLKTCTEAVELRSKS